MPLRRLCGLLIVLLLTGCYLPSDFTADIRITPKGNYNFQYVGQLTYLPLLQKIEKGTLSQAQTAAEVKALTADLARDKGFQEISYLDRASFHVRYKHVGNILKEKTFTFVRMNSRLLSLVRRPDGTIEISGDKPNTENAKRIAATGLVMKGRLRIQTEAKVMQQNATRVIQATPPVYVWQIKGIEQPSPHLVLATGR